MSGPTTALRRVTVTSSVDAQGNCMVRDTLGKEWEINVTARVGGGPAPRPEELWIMATIPGQPRMLVSRLFTPPTPVISGSRAGNTTLVLSLLDALAALGLIDDQSTP